MIISINGHFRVSSNKDCWAVQRLEGDEWHFVGYFGSLPALIRSLPNKGAAGYTPAGLPVPPELTRLAERVAGLEAIARRARDLKPVYGWRLDLEDGGWNIQADQLQFIAHDGHRPRTYHRTLAEALAGYVARRVRLIEGEGYAAAVADELFRIEAALTRAPYTLARMASKPPLKNTLTRRKYEPQKTHSPRSLSSPGARDPAGDLGGAGSTGGGRY